MAGATCRKLPTPTSIGVEMPTVTFREHQKTWGSGRLELHFEPQIRIPALEHRSELLIQGFRPRL
jgi:hypothetical protein